MPGAFLIADLPGMLRTDEFAATARVTSGEHAGEDIVGVLDNPPSDAFGVEMQIPAFVAPSWPPLAEGDTLSIPDPVSGLPRSYRVKLPEPDDTGVTRYPLTKV